MSSVEQAGEWKGYWVQEESEVYVARSLEEAKAHVHELTGDPIEEMSGGEADPNEGFETEEGNGQYVTLAAYIAARTWTEPMQLLTYYA